MPQLTPAQLRVLVALCRPPDGPASNEEIADELTVSIDTVKTHMRALFDAFTCRRRRRTASASSSSGWRSTPGSSAARPSCSALERFALAVSLPFAS